MNKIDVLLGLQWGDEGKGKIVDVLSPHYNIVARFQGGPNAGHTLEFNNTKHVLHIIPSGIFHEHITNVIGNGVVLDPVIFKKESETLIKAGAHPTNNLIISPKTHLILPSHRFVDAAMEASKGNAKIGSTLKGIGPTYTDKTARNGLRVGDIFLPDFKDRYNKLKQQHIITMDALHYNADWVTVEEDWFDGIEYLRKFQQRNVEYLLNDAILNDKKILAEGAQGTLLDIDYGTYPFVTSSNTVCAGACTGLGIAPSHIGRVFGIFKAYCTRVGSGPFPTELNDEMGELLRKNGREFGSTTGRPRRCGWLDLVALNYSIMINGVTDLIMTKADVMTGMPIVNVATEYLKGNEVSQEFPYTIENVFPKYQPFQSWKHDLNLAKAVEELPEEIKTYIGFVQQQTKVPVSILSTGPDRNQTLFINHFKI